MNKMRRIFKRLIFHHQIFQRKILKIMIVKITLIKINYHILQRIFKIKIKKIINYNNHNI